MKTTNSISGSKKFDKGHVFYRYEDNQFYINHLMSFIKNGLDSKQRILIIESMRTLPLIKANINKRFNHKQQESIRLVNNFDYYLANGDFHTETILTHFQEDLSMLKMKNTMIRTWAHVEWASEKPDVLLLEEFESTADNFVKEEGLVSVCAYAADSLSSTLDTTLQQLHQYIMTDHNFFISPFYDGGSY
ncbi:MEDS domain-containing protein [Priestia aryabhattai]|uniref:MEDS domain-containing protein n=1 Tax=Priestia aryabhattai TaxID=412384 RepID=UPI001CCC8E64|nr:MEDS domain-containing protein [Priestia aryabhattai]MBZ6488538.1 MEDS domain-containing protein [Priestia aryabhattai]MDH3111172.1 MEDS domain-containing protein [Priestia aryabhattai]MDH3129841.1 MEDS domain-containing protein [Priestia aryabhattai]MDH3130230.1 MEDS domain-containing protein [Priestia aryabhattai]